VKKEIIWDRRLTRIKIVGVFLLFAQLGGGKARFRKRAQKTVEGANGVVAASAKATLLEIWAVSLS
jgi:hypothetical protein